MACWLELEEALQYVYGARRRKRLIYRSQRTKSQQCSFGNTALKKLSSDGPNSSIDGLSMPGSDGDIKGLSGPSSPHSMPLDAPHLTTLCDRLQLPGYGSQSQLLRQKIILFSKWASIDLIVSSCNFINGYQLTSPTLTK